MRKLYGLSIGLLLLCVQCIYAQTKQVSGKIADAKDGAPLPGATITAQGTSLAVKADAAGLFSITVPTGTKNLIVTIVGYKTQTVPASGTNLTIQMEVASETIDEVVVTGYTTIQRKKFAGATANVSVGDVKTQPFGSFDQALQGGASGVSVVANSGQPGANAVVRIRGNGSITGSNVPLYIMDGIEISAADFASVNQGDFERVEILKDAVATSMYGSRGANGVIVISTKKGKAGQLSLNYDGQIGFSKLPENRLKVMNSDQKITYELQRGNPYGWTAAQQDSLRKVNFNWQDALFQTGVTQQHQVSASAGNQTTRVFTSLAYMKQEGIVKTTGLDRYTVRVNVDNTIKNWKFGVNLLGGYSKIVGTGEGNTTLATPLNAIRWSNPYERAIDPRTNDYQETGKISPTQGVGTLTSGQPNGAMELFLNFNNALQMKGIGTTYLEFQFPFVKGLSARTNWGIDYTQNETETYTSPRTSTGFSRLGVLSRAMNRNFRYTGTTSLNYKRSFGEHEVEVGVFTEVVKNTFRSFGFTGYGLTNGFRNETGITPGSASNPNYIPLVTGNGTHNGILSYFSILNYGYASKYYVTLVGRRDGASRFGTNNRFANYGSVGLTWAVSSEKFMESISFVDDLRLRASFGTTGNNNPGGDFRQYPLFSGSSYAGVSGWAPNFGNLGNPDLRWETNQTLNIGIDFGFLKRRITGTIEYYNRLTKDLFYNQNTDPVGAGGQSIFGNFGKLRNAGVEVTLGGDIVRTKDLRWNVTGNITYNRNEIVDIPVDSLISGLTIQAKGKPINSLYLVEYAGVDPANGNAMYTKRNGTKTAVYSASDKKIWGTSDAPWFGGVSTTIEYKGIDLSAQLNFFLDRWMYNNDRNNVTNPTYFYDNMDVAVLKEWQKAGDITDVPRPSSGTAGGTAPANPYQTQVTRFLEDASFWRLRNVTLGYTVPAKFLSRAKLRSARVFIQAQNLWTKTDFQSFDPEMTGTSLTGAQYPALKQTTIGLSIGL